MIGVAKWNHASLAIGVEWGLVLLDLVKWKSFADCVVCRRLLHLLCSWSGEEVQESLIVADRLA